MHDHQKIRNDEVGPDDVAERGEMRAALLGVLEEMLDGQEVTITTSTGEYTGKWERGRIAFARKTEWVKYGARVWFAGGEPIESG